TGSIVMDAAHVHADDSLTAEEILSDSNLVLLAHEEAHGDILSEHGFGDELAHVDSLSSHNETVIDLEGMLDLGSTSLESLLGDSSTTESSEAGTVAQGTGTDQLDPQGGVNVYTQDPATEIPPDTPLA
ncbi:MAG: hypothetical protein V3V61_08180, partial [Gammaproteobacteria bacterium]